MSVNYASNWGVTDAVREIFQNALDAQTENSENKMQYWRDGNKLYVSNKNSVLKTESLLMGVSSKAEDDSLIGQYGEGYKVATVVLKRNGVTVRIYNNEAKEVWVSKIVNSRRYGNNKIVAFDIDKGTKMKEYGLVFELDGITDEQFEEIIASNLHLQSDLGEVVESKAGKLLLDKRFAGMVYVNGLFVCKKSQFKWGYDFHPKEIRLDRDRGLIDCFDLQFATAKMILGIGDVDFIINNFKTWDIEYIHHYIDSTDISKVLSDKAYDNFIKVYGDGAIPVTSQEECDVYKSAGYNAIFVPRNEQRIINLYHRVEPKKSQLEVEFDLWCEKVSEVLSEEQLNEIKELWKRK